MQLAKWAWLKRCKWVEGLRSSWRRLLGARARGWGWWEFQGCPQDQSQLSPFPVSEEKLHGRGDISGSLFIGERASLTCQICYKEAGKQEVAGNMKVLGIIESESQKGRVCWERLACTPGWFLRLRCEVPVRDGWVSGPPVILSCGQKANSTLRKKTSSL